MVAALDKIKSVSFVVNDGSGVLLQAMIRDYSYVITAKHVIQIDKNRPENGILPLDEILIHRPDDTHVIARSVYLHPHLDLAIIKVDFIDLRIELDRSELERNDSLILYGYPNYNANHRNNEISRQNWIETYDVNVLDYNDEEIKTRVSEDAQLSDIEGFSGGGIFRIKEGKPFLVGIEYAFEKSGQYVNRILSIPITNIHKIVEDAGIALVRPVFFGDLFELKSALFQFENCISQDDVKKATDILKSRSTNLQQDCEITPYKVLKEYQEVISCISDEYGELEEREFWIAFLEFLHVNELISPQENWDGNFLEYLRRSYKFVYIKSKKGYRGFLPQILSTDVEHLRQGGKMLVVDFGQMPPSPDKLNYYRDRIPNNVANGIEEESIAHVQSMSQKSISIIHLPKLHDHCIIDREEALEAMNRVSDREQIIQLITDGYSEYLSQEEMEHE
jgi:hypothetical protein